MGETESAQALEQGLASALARVGRPAPEGVHRLTGGATMESWRLTSGDEDLVLRRAPSLSFMEGRPFGHDSEAAIIRAAHAAGVTAPEILVELEPDDGIGSGFVMRALPGTPDPRAILEMDRPDELLREIARDLAKIHSGTSPGRSAGWRSSSRTRVRTGRSSRLACAGCATISPNPSPRC